MSEEQICRGSGKGLVLPLGGEDENSWNNTLRVILYLTGLLYCFMGVALIADVFMGAIEKITSKKTRVLNKNTGRHTTVEVWNPTVANLTLMALGSSAPEILLNVIFIFADGYFQEGLGPSTIVGSAAFNLFCISAVCVLSIPNGEVRYIKEMPVYCVTAFFSIFAYVWLIIILMVISPNIVEIWEGVFTFLWFPVLVYLAYLADRGYLNGKCGSSETKSKSRINAFTTSQELAALEARIRSEHGANLTDAQVLRFIEQEHSAPKSRAHYRNGAIREMTGGRRVEACKVEDPLYSVMPVATYDDQSDLRKSWSYVGFQAARYAVLESEAVFKCPVSRRGNTQNKASVYYKTRDGAAKAPQDYLHVEGRLDFGPGENLKTIEVPIVDDSSYEIDEEFFIDLVVPPECGTDSSMTMVDDLSTVEVVIIDDDDPGVLCFELSEITVIEAPVDKHVLVKVCRRCGGSGRITCRYHAEDDTAVHGSDYELPAGELVFEAGQITATIDVLVKASGRYENTEQFRVIIKDATGGARFHEETDGGADCCIVYVRIEADREARERVDRMMGNLRVNWDKAELGSRNWKEQFMNALYVNGGEDDDCESGPPGVTDYVLHVINFPWKLLCACVPPTDFIDGWASFIASLMVIGGVTAIIGDMAGLLGCCMFGPGSDGLTAITFVALGTSLPDTFASKAAAQQDPHADASIGNVTGSNSVNVFLGLGLPWMIAAIYWPVAGPNEKWRKLYGDKDWAQGYLNGALAVEDPGLGSSVAVYSCLAVVAMSVLSIRRKLYGGELGGPRPEAIATSVLFVLLWVIFIVAYILMR